MTKFKGSLSVLALALAAGSADAAGPADGINVFVGNTPLPVTIQNQAPASGTKQLFDEFLTIDRPDYRDNPQVGPIDVTAYKTIRVVLRRGSCGPCGATPIQAYIRTVGTATSEPRTIDKVAIDGDDGDIGEFASRAYDTVGTSLVISFSSAAGSNSSIRAIVFGRNN